VHPPEVKTVTSQMLCLWHVVVATHRGQHDKAQPGSVSPSWRRV